MRRTSAINDTRIKYILVCGKLYEVEQINFFDFNVQAREIDLTIADVPEEEVFDISDFKDFRIKLHNWNGNLVDFESYIKSHR